MRGRRVLAAIGLCTVAAGCHLESHSEPDGNGKLRQLVAPSERPFVVFLDRSLFIGRLEMPVAPPVTVGSSPSPATISSDAADIVSIDPSGRLVAHRSGSTVIRAAETGSILQVEVRDAEAFRATPQKLELAHGGEASVRIATRDGTAVPPLAMTWATSAPDVATVSNGVVRAGTRPGTAHIVAQYRDVQITIPVQAALASIPAFSVRPEKASVRIGETLSFQALSRAGPIVAKWTTSNPRVATHLGDSVFRGAMRGEALVCATSATRRSCTEVEVKP